MTNPTQGIFLVATGDTCRCEARFAIEQLAKSNSSIPLTVFTDSGEAFCGYAPRIGRVEVIPEPRFSFGDKIYGFVNAPYECNIYMDSDTVAVGDISGLFALLGRFDIAACQGVGAMGKRHNAGADGDVPEAFAELNTGVVCFRRSAQTRACFERWRDLYARNPQHVHDQPAFRQAVYESALSLCVLPPEYNFLGGLAVLSGKVRVFHSPTISAKPEPFWQFAKDINECDDVRLFVPPGRIFRVRRSAPA